MLLRANLLAWFVTFVGCTLKVLVLATEEPFLGCVNHPLSSCPVGDEETICKCQRVDANTTVVCCNIDSDYKFKESLACVSQNQAGVKTTPVTALHLLNCTIEKLDASEMTRPFQQLIGISVTQSRISRISGSFPQSVTCLNLSSNQLIEILPSVLTNMPQLGYLDLSNNNLTHLPNITFRNPKAYFIIDVSGNSGLKCSDLLDELKAQRNSSTHIKFMNENDTYCSTSLNYQWFNSVNIVPFHQIETVEKIEKECPHSLDFQCKCMVMRNVEMPFHFYYMVRVDCSGQGLTELPQHLPSNTYYLNISNNNITSLEYLSNHNDYAHILHLVADNNRIESITELEGTKFIDRFFVLSLRSNRIKLIPKYMLANAFDRNDAANRIVMLGNNYLPCDCSTAQFLKVWLLHYTKNIHDYRELYCENLNNMRVIDLDQSKVCVYPRDWTDYIYYIIALEIMLFILLFVKVFYDYWVFKTTGYLPWPASKMPRLPCDWFFEL